ncbi:MAG TPA: ankyrin repeat domain-containing protein [Candidatus Polarisedimenticolia bacterium]|nr:ankyrin repeat domain-containing protein [Candidatus Polarisedimenticolia bacterium]
MNEVLVCLLLSVVVAATQHIAGTEEFIAAVKQGDEGRIESMLKESARLAAARDPEGVSAPLLALYHGKKEIAQRLAASKEAVEPLDVFEAAAFGRIERLTALLSTDPGLANAYAQDGFFPLGLAAFYGQEKAVTILISAGADPNLTARNSMKVRALHAAAAAHSLPIADQLIAGGADLNAPQQGGFTPLHEAAGSGQVALARRLIDAGADVNAKADDGRTALSMALDQQNQEMVQLLRARGAVE